LLGALQQFSQGLLGRTKTLQDDLDELVQECRGADLRIQNTFNELLLLSNSQFIEHVSVPPLPAPRRRCSMAG
jgi:hypothetical protein